MSKNHDVSDFVLWFSTGLDNGYRAVRLSNVTFMQHFFCQKKFKL